MWLRAATFAGEAKSSLADLDRLLLCNCVQCQISFKIICSRCYNDVNFEMFIYARWLSFSNWVIFLKIVMEWNPYIVFFINVAWKEILQFYEIKFHCFFSSSCFLVIFRSQSRRVGILEAVSSARRLSQMRTLLQERWHPIAEWQLFMIVMRNENLLQTRTP